MSSAPWPLVGALVVAIIGIYFAVCRPWRQPRTILKKNPAEPNRDNSGTERSGAVASVTTNANPDRDETQEEAQEQERHSRARRECTMVFFTAVIAAATIVQGLTSFYQWDISRKALDANERAWVLVQAQGFALRPQTFAENPQGFPLLNGVMVNSGKSPAFRVVYVARVSFELARPDIPPEESGDWKEASGLDLAPGGGTGGTSLLYATFGPKGFPPEKYAAVEKGDLSLFIWVFVRYSDPFSDDRFTQKCIRYSPKSVDVTRGAGGAAFSGLILCPSRYQIHR